MPEDFQIDDQDDGSENGFSGDPNNGFEPVPPVNRTSKNQKLAVAGLAVFAFLIVMLWSIQLKNSIYAPLNGPINTTETDLAGNQTADDQALKNKDTDGDGLSDYDELNIYNTSAYIADSDGDGLSDGAEVKNGTDPNCPAGRTCAANGLSENGAGVSPSTPSSSSADAFNNLSAENQAVKDLLNQQNAAQSAAGTGAGLNAANQPASPTGGSTGSAGNLTPDQKNALKNIDAATLRQMLLQAGMQKDVLDQIGDEELMKSYSEILQ